MRENREKWQEKKGFVKKQVKKYAKFADARK